MDNLNNADAKETKPRRGIKKQFFGCVLLSLGLLNVMMSLKAGLELDWFNYLLIISGAVFLSVGIWQSRD